jgi:2-polyprenyl-3-methyl-5-hydroxy-6-metoxy-1,4-benzoquinol methylase
METKDKYEVNNCDICGIRTQTKVFSVNAEFDILKCNYCNLCWTSPRLSQENLINEYAKNTADIIASKEYIEEYLIPVENQKEDIINNLKLSPGGYVLDVGCGEGEFLLRMQKRGFLTVGIDSFKLAVEIAKAKGLNIIYGDVEEILDEDIFFKHNQMDIITLWHVLEHLPSPSRILQKLNKILKENGLVIIAVPNFASIQAMLFKEDWFALRIPQHLYHFSPNSLYKLCNKTGFTILNCFPALPVHATASFINSCVSKIKKYKKRNIAKYLFYRSLIPLTPIFISIENILKKMSAMCLIAQKVSK